jgi:hypothetical protein
MLLKAWIIASRALIPSQGAAAYIRSIIKGQYRMSCLSKVFCLEHIYGKSGNKTSINWGRMAHKRYVNISIESSIDKVYFASASFFRL